jgi:hypothetical protein
VVAGSASAVGSASSAAGEGKYKVNKKYDDKEDPNKSKFLDALKKYNRRND